MKYKCIPDSSLTTVALVFYCLMVPGGLADAAIPNDWLQFRGSNSDGISQEKGLLKEWPESGPEVLWRTPLGTGYSGIIVSGDLIYTMDADEEDEYLVCMNAEDGTNVWRTKIGARFKNSYGDGPRSTPTLDGEVIYAIGANGRMIAANPATGEEIWRVEIAERFTFKSPGYWWGFSMSPFIDGDMILLQVGGEKAGSTIAAIDKNSGNTLWTTHSDLACYSTPIAVNVNGVKQFVFVTANKVVSVSREGMVNWSYDWGGSFIKVAMPVFVPPNKIFVSAAYDIGAVLLEIGEDGTSVGEVWNSKIMRNHFHTSIRIGPHMYGFDNATLKCIETETQTEKWGKRRLGKGSLVCVDGQFIVLSERGKLVLIDANPEEYVERGSMQVFDSKTWTAPTLSNGRLFLRDQKEMVCLKLKKSQSS